MIHARADYNRIQDPAKKIAADEPVFLLRAKDKLMPEVTAYWAQRLREEGGDEHMVEMANNHAFLAKEWQQKNGCKLPDMPEDITSTRKFKLKRFYKLTNINTEEASIAYYYFNPDANCEGFGFNVADGGGFLPIAHITDNTIIEEIFLL